MTATVLIIDEDESVTRSMVRLLCAHGFNARGLSLTDRLLEVASELQPTAIIVDLHMPQCSGIELGRQIRAEHRLVSARLVGMSATIPDWDPEALAVFDVVLAKPILAETLLRAIRG